MKDNEIKVGDLCLLSSGAPVTNCSEDLHGRLVVVLCKDPDALSDVFFFVLDMRNETFSVYNRVLHSIDSVIFVK